MGHRLLISTGKGLFQLNQTATSWQFSEAQLAGWEVTCAIADGTRLIVGTTHYAYGATIRISDDNGATWRQPDAQPRYPEGSPYKVNRIWELVRDPKTGRIYCGIDEAALFYSDDRGESWQLVEALTNLPSRPHWQPGGGGLCLHTILVDPKKPGRMWVGISAVGAFRTDDNGATWTNLNKTLPALPTGSSDPDAACCVHRMVQDRVEPDTLYMQFHGGVFRSRDAGNTWDTIENGLPGNFGFPMVATPSGRLMVVPLVADTQRYAHDGRLRVYASDDHGDSWHDSSTGLSTEPRYVGVLRSAMIADTKSDLVAFGTTMGEMNVSTDAGHHWTAIPGQLQRIMHVTVG